MLKPRLEWLLALIPVSLAAHLVFHLEPLVFFASAGAILPLAALMGRATEELAIRLGPRAGGILNATSGNLTELIIAIFLIRQNEFDVLKASLTGSILGNLLLVLGLSFLAGGLKHTEQQFNVRAAGLHSQSLTLAVIGLLMPALFVITSGGAGHVQREVVSGVVAVVLMALYAGALLFSLVTHEHLFRTPVEDEEPSWSYGAALAVLGGSAALVGLESELLVGSLEHTVASLGLTKFFVGLIIVPIVGNAAEHGAAVVFALRNKLDVTLEIAIGSSVQIALFVAPLLVFVSLALGHPMDFVFTPFEVASVGLSTLIVAIIVQDGRSNWLEGAQLVGAYVLMGVSFFFVGGS